MMIKIPVMIWTAGSYTWQEWACTCVLWLLPQNTCTCFPVSDTTVQALTSLIGK